MMMDHDEQYFQCMMTLHKVIKVKKNKQTINVNTVKGTGMMRENHLCH